MLLKLCPGLHARINDRPRAATDHLGISLFQNLACLDYGAGKRGFPNIDKALKVRIMSRT